MKRALVSYKSDSENDNEPENPPVKRKKPLPKLAPSLTPTTPIDDPSKHQGRLRSQPFVDGQWATYIYVPVDQAPILALLQRMFEDVRAWCPELEVFSLLESSRMEEEGEEKELHLSLSRPIYVRAHQRDSIKRRVKEVASETRAFDVSFASFSVLDNDEKTRSFLCVEVGAGHNELSHISTSFRPLLEELRQPTYYDHPRYHTSFAWILTAKTDAPRFPDSLVDRLEKKYGEILRSSRMFVEDICTRIGKEVTRKRLIPR